jgi:hypothetical protein
LIVENNETMKIVVQDDGGKMLMQEELELEEDVSNHWIIVNHSLRILLFTMTLGLGVLSVVLVVEIGMALLG